MKTCVSYLFKPIKRNMSLLSHDFSILSHAPSRFNTSIEPSNPQPSISIACTLINPTMPPKADKAKKWSKADDKKLVDLIKSRGNNINPSSSRSNVKTIHQYWPHRKDTKQFYSLIRGKLQQLELEGFLSGHRRFAEGEYCALLV